MITASEWFVVRQPKPKAKLRLFCFPYAGGTPAVYKEWGAALEDIEVCAVQLPGRGMRMNEPAYVRVEPLVEALAEAMLPYLDRPFALFGHSLGGLIAFQTARLLEERFRRSPVHLFISGRLPPHVPEEQVHHLSDPEFIQVLRDYNGTPQEVLNDPDLMSYFLPVLRSDFELSNTFRLEGRPQLFCPFSVYSGIDDSLVDPELLEQWERYTKYRFSLQMFPGDHFYLNADQAPLFDMLYNEVMDSLYASGVC
ncbi:thioesterase [Paenibacillus spiritus]|uniref:Thioesterase n=1 Tax=Paenibacillus spiritus TaxID=2496557 RepID=A0A5J5GJV6_9BACL|nr:MULTISPECIES: alpha/beta fold hydrolase [Paenibacillus]KAA9008556.1 thioesterase [Paenibacillus spiritus]